MLKRNVRFGFIASILVVAILLQPLWPALSLIALASDKPEAASLSPVPAQATSGCSRIYLPVILKQSGSAASTANSNSTSVSVETLIPAPDFAIISPGEGWTISGMLFFAAQPLASTGVSSVTFKAGSTDLGTDTTPADGFKVFLNASTFPAGPLQLTATASGPCGQTTQTIGVTVKPNPPSSGIIGSQGGVLASQIGSLITFPPGTVPNNTSVSVTEKTQQQVTTDNGIDWAAMGVTFLGAQDIQSSAPFSKPLGVVSAGFGNRVQPGQVVVNYRIAPDANGDGVDEIIVVNTASVAPNNDVIADPVPQIQLGSVATISGSGGSSIRALNGGISGPPGIVIEIPATGFNPASAVGNVAIFRSIDGIELEMPASVSLSYPNSDSGQTVSVLIPPLPPGLATLSLRNESTGSIKGPINISVAYTPLT